MKTVLQYENITANNLAIFAENNFSGAKKT
jgi:hypothetical protein